MRIPFYCVREPAKIEQGASDAQLSALLAALLASQTTVKVDVQLVNVAFAVREGGGRGHLFSWRRLQPTGSAIEPTPGNRQ
jgi:hypothetical protein